MALVFYFLLSLNTVWATPEECSPVDLSAIDESGSSPIPIWSQGNSNLCYAFAASSLIDHYRFRRGDKDQNHITSPLLLSLKTIEQYQDAGSSLKGGKVEHAFATAKKHGSCGIQSISDKLGSAPTDLVLETLSQHYKDAQKFPDQKSVIAESTRRFLLFSKIKDEELPEISEIIDNFSLSQSQFIISTLMRFCKESKKLEYLPSPKLLFQPNVGISEILQRTQAALSSQTPVGINYCANVVTEPNHQGHMQGYKWICEKNKNHSAIVVGRRWMDGKCNFLVQDSGCEGYKKNPGSCHGGKYWLPEDLLAKNLHGIFWLDEK